MTGGGPVRGAPDDDARRPSSGGARRDTWRGPRGESRGTPAPRPGAFGDSWTGRPELEELPAQPVMPRGTPRLGLSGTLAVVAIIALLAAGFGVLGGRPEPTPVPTPRPSRPRATQVVVAPATPRVTPWVDCGPPPTTVPEVLLEVDGRPTPGSVEVISSSNGPPSAGATTAGPTAPTASTSPARVEVPVDVITELWVEGGACAIAWSIDLVFVDLLDSISNPAADPGYAAQNRFALSLLPYAGSDYELRAVLVFETLVLRVTWPIHVVPFERPAAILEWGAVPIPLVEGCDLSLLPGGRPEPLELTTCADDLSTAPGTPMVVRPGERGVFELPGWPVDVGDMTCGHLSGLSFVAQPAPGCSIGADLVDGQAIFDAPADAGAWTIAISACGLESVAVDSPLYFEDRLCGTWYAEVEFRD